VKGKGEGQWQRRSTRMKDKGERQETKTGTRVRDKARGKEERALPMASNDKEEGGR